MHEDCSQIVGIWGWVKFATIVYMGFIVNVYQMNDVYLSSFYWHKLNQYFQLWLLIVIMIMFVVARISYIVGLVAKNFYLGKIIA